jgi:DNA-binding GntR family transcriptional regulator
MTCRSQTDRSRAASPVLRRTRRALQRDHDDILEAIRGGDTEAAARLTTDHVRHGAAIRDKHPELRATGEQDREDLI